MKWQKILLVVEDPKASSHHFVVLSSLEVSILEEGEFPQLETQNEDPEVNAGTIEQDGLGNLELPSVDESMQEDHPSPNRTNSFPYYVEIAKNKPVDSSRSFDEDSIEQLSKKTGMKS